MPQDGAGRPAERLAFDIPAQPLADALHAFAKVTQTQILYDSSLRGARRSAPVQGVFSPEEAMQKLLAGTGLEANYTAAHDVVLTLIAPPAGTFPPMPRQPGEAMLSLDTLLVPAPPQPVIREDVQAERWYATTVQAEVLRALQREPAVRGGSYRVLARIWIDAGGTIQRSALGRSTGSKQRDTAIMHVLDGLTLSQPPQGLRQPLGIVLTSSS